MNKNIIITGIHGVIGQVLQKGLSGDFTITGLDLPQHDVSQMSVLTDVAQGQSAIIHLAWDTKTDSATSGKINPQNAQMFFNVYEAALNYGIPRVIVASSVHADTFYDYHGSELLSPYRISVPDSPYGAEKIFMESLGRYFSVKGVEVVCVRFGGVSPENQPNKNNENERKVFFHHDDCISLLKAILTTKVVPNNFSIVYGVSDNPGRIHDISNPFGWIPKKYEIF